MENLIFNSDKKLDFANLVRIADLSYFEGPLLSLFEELNSGHLYLFDWVDRDMKSNRWLIYRVSPTYLLLYINSKISHLELFDNRPNGSVFFTDIDSQNRPFYNYDAFELKIIPENYLPNRDNFFDLADCNSFDKIKSIVIGSLSRQKSENEYSKNHLVGIPQLVSDKSYYSNRIPDSNKIPSGIFLNKKIFNYYKLKHEVMFLNTLRYLESRVLNTQTLQLKRKKEYANQYN